MNGFMIYLLGACIAGLLFNLMLNINSFHNYVIDNINNAKNELKKEKNYSSLEASMLDNIDNESIVNIYNISLTLLSWVGLILVFGNILKWAIK